MIDDDGLATEFRTVGELRVLLEGLPDDRLVLAQVAASDGTAWMLMPSFVRKVTGGTVAALSLSHHRLATLPSMEVDT